MAIKDVLSRVAQVSPALGAMLTGNGDAAAAFLEGYQRTTREVEAKRRQQQMDAREQAQVTEARARQQLLDTQTADERTRRQLLEELSLPEKLSNLAGTASTPDEAQALLSSALPALQALAGERATGYLTAAQQRAEQRLLTQGRQALTAWLDNKYYKSRPYQEILRTKADPKTVRVVNLPPELQRLFPEPPTLDDLMRFSVPPETKDASYTLSPGQVRFDPQTNQPIASVPDRPPSGAGVLNDVQSASLVDGLLDGTLVPSMLSKRGDYNAILGQARAKALAQTGKPYNAARAQTEYGAAQRFIASMNGPRQLTFRALGESVLNTMDRVLELSAEIKNSGIPLANRAKLAVYIQTMGNSPQGQLASQYLTAVNTLKEEFANLANGGYAPTEPAWKLADQQINANYGVQQLDASIREAQRLIRYRLQGLADVTPVGVSSENPVFEGGQTPGTGLPDPLGIRKPKTPTSATDPLGILPPRK